MKVISDSDSSSLSSILDEEVEEEGDWWNEGDVIKL